MTLAPGLLLTDTNSFVKSPVSDIYQEVKTHFMQHLLPLSIYNVMMPFLSYFPSPHCRSDCNGEVWWGVGRWVERERSKKRGKVFVSVLVYR